MFLAAELYSKHTLLPSDCQGSDSAFNPIDKGIFTTIYYIVPSSAFNAQNALLGTYSSPYSKVKELCLSIIIAIVISLLYRYGPLIYLWSMRFEGKHKQFKDAAKGTSFKNILKTLTEHHQRMMAFDLHYNSLFASVTVSIGSGTHFKT